MGLIKNRKFAWCITIVIMIASLFFGAYRSLSVASSGVEEQFYTGVYDEKQDYIQPSIDSQLNKCVDASMGILTVVNHYDSLKNEAEKLRSARQALIDADTISEKYTANASLIEAYNSACTALDRTELVESDKTALSIYRSTFDGAQGVISNSLYNDEVSEFSTDILSSFPAGILKYITGSDMPEYFN